MVPAQTSLAQNQAAITAGEQIFQASCFACHGIGEAQRVGPDLAGVHEKRTQDWLVQSIRSPQTMFDQGDETAVALFGEFNGMAIPDSAVSDQQIGQVLAYIESRSLAIASTVDINTGAAEPAAVIAAAPALPENVSSGADLFQGRLRFENSGPACNACHDVQNDAITGGGTLAVELTSAYSRMGGAGLTAILANAPFPAMQTAYGEKPLVEEEVALLVAFFQSAAAQSNQQQKNYAFNLFISGTLGAGVLFGLIPLIWRNRRIGSVNQSIYDRQHTS
jgi:mono/diheme cytochrome c family protein